MKQKYLVLLCLMILSMLCFYYFSAQGINSTIREIKRHDNTIKKDQDKLNSAKVLNEQLKEVSKVITSSMSETKQFTPGETNEFIKKLATLADEYKIAVNTIFPKVIDTSNRNLLEQQYTMILNCTFIQMGQFLSKLESFDNIIKIKTLDVSPIKIDRKVNTEIDAVTRYQVTIELSTFKIVKEA
ncbi:MAG: hypothetical protein K9N09_08605 [Candidatus Cloacimonetes bacterium]|nr:hypothetical protein [Candidatus Cloacimonadota bacterium]MCF7814156.1 hypothetical protein [Candidatus Cloacimonadota bacterium]MCF7868745.1 hypothetical protein [Candidatus Cloacimonadota bacterium]MCF7884155.1 hypothetical protein [Candidatus Cloacimonadota bacterium]